MNKEYRICTKCLIHHYENCNTCFGFGIYEPDDSPGKTFPVIAAAAHGFIAIHGKFLPCPECDSTIKGISK